MKIIWKIEATDTKKLQSFLTSTSNNYFVCKRKDRNVKREGIVISKNQFWEQMVGCLLTTQQRSGPKSNVTRFLNIKPFPLSLRRCKNSKDINLLVISELQKSGGIRRTNKIADEIRTNITFLDSSFWSKMLVYLNRLMHEDNPALEREAAQLIAKNLKGFGPKQSRNLLQGMGLTKYEIPIDSRITKWLNEFGFPIELSASSLSDEPYYSFVSDGIQELCKKANIFPCILDASIFSTFDNDEWDKDNIVW